MESLAISFPLESNAERIVTPLVVRQAGVLNISHGTTVQPFAARALWDTGSTGCCISNELAEKVGLKSVGSTKLTSSQGDSENLVYPVDILLADGIAVESIPAAGVKTGELFDFIIGMNIIRLGDFVLLRNENKLEFHFRVK
jgi:predicted aspartyl protease